MSPKSVKDLTNGEYVYIEDHWGDFRKVKVTMVGRIIYVRSDMRFSRKTGWEVFYRRSKTQELRSGIRKRSRIHNGDGILYTQEYVDRFGKLLREERYRTELIWQAIRTSPLIWRRLTTEQLEQINGWLAQ